MSDAEEKQYILKLFATDESRWSRIEDILRYAGQDSDQTLIPDGLLKDVAVILPALREELAFTQGSLLQAGDLLGEAEAKLAASQAHMTELGGR